MSSPMKLPNLDEDMVIFSALVPRDFDMEFEAEALRILEIRLRREPGDERQFDFAQAKSVLLQLIGNSHFEALFDDEDQGLYDESDEPFPDDLPFDGDF